MYFAFKRNDPILQGLTKAQLCFFWGNSNYLQLYSSGNVSAQLASDRYSGFSVRPVRLVAVSAATTTEGYNEEKDFEW